MKTKGEQINLNAVDETPVEGVSRMDPRTYHKLRKLQQKEKAGNFPKKKVIRKEKDKDAFPDVVPVALERLKRHDTGADALDPLAMSSQLQMKKFVKKKSQFQKRAETAARAEILNEEQAGFLEAEHGELTHNIRQVEIAQNVDMASAVKHFDLHLEQFGPYHIDYTDNGRHLLLGGRRGHVASMDWYTKKLHAETNVMETVRDVKWLHTEMIYAIAQKNYVYVYDNTGTELHCIKTMPETKQLEFLPRHFLLVSGSSNSWLKWLDVSVGKEVAAFCTRSGPLDVLCQNPANAIIHAAHPNGTVSLWSPNSNEPLVKMLAHNSTVKGIAVDETGRYMVTTGIDARCRIWDVRMYKQLHSYNISAGPVCISQKMSVACAVQNTVMIFNDMHLGQATAPYLAHRCAGAVKDLKFVPYEDVLGVGHSHGFTSLLVPGCGEANVDALRANPFETKTQRKEREVKQLLDKLQPDLICLDPDEIGRVNEDLLERQQEERKKLLYIRPVSIAYTPKHKMKGRSSGAHKLQPDLICLDPDEIGRVNEDLLERQQEERKKLLYIRPVSIAYTPKHKMKGRSSGAHKEHRKDGVRSDIRVEQNMEKEQVEREYGIRGETAKAKDAHVLDRFKS